MSDGEFPFRSFTIRPDGYDREEVDLYVEQLRGEVTELRRAVSVTDDGLDADVRLHDPEGAVKRTLAIAQETADRVLHDARVESDRRRTDADEHATATIADADARAAKLLADIELQAAEVREQGVIAARSAIKVERDKAMGELAQVRRVRNDLRAEAVELKAALDRYRHQSREASDTLAAAAAGPLLAVDLPDYVDAEVTLAGLATTEPSAERAADPAPAAARTSEAVTEPSHIGGHLRSVEAEADLPPTSDPVPATAAKSDGDDPTSLAEVISIDSETDTDAHYEYDLELPDDTVVDEPEVAETSAHGTRAASAGTFLSEVSGSSDDLASDRSDSFLSELRDAADDADDDDADDGFFDRD